MKVIAAYEKDIDDDLMAQVMYMNADAYACYDMLDSNEDEHVICAIPTTTVKQFRRKSSSVLFFLAVKRDKGKTRLVGMAGLSKESKSTLQLHDVYVKPLFRNRGIGHKLVKTAMKEAKKQKRCLSLKVNPLNDAALKLYEDFGFKICKEQSIKMMLV